MADWIFDFDFFCSCSICKEDLHSIGDGTFVWFEVFAAIARVFAYNHLSPKHVDSRVSCGRILVIIRSQHSEQQADGGHVLEAMVPVSWIVERAFLIDDSNCGFLGCDDDFANLVDPITNLRMQFDCSFDGGLSVELGR